MKARKLMVSAVCLTLVAAAALAQEPARMKRRLQLSDQLGLSAEQRTAVAQAERDMWSKVQPLSDQMSQQWSELDTLLEAAGADPTEIGQRLIAIHAVQKQVRALRQDYRAQLKAVLTPDQRATLERLDSAGEGGERQGRERFK